MRSMNMKNFMAEFRRFKLENQDEPQKIQPK
jgi:hypothetical protein